MNRQEGSESSEVVFGESLSAKADKLKVRQFEVDGMSYYGDEARAAFERYCASLTKDLRAENARLRAENGMHPPESHRMWALYEENERLRAQLAEREALHRTESPTECPQCLGSGSGADTPGGPWNCFECKRECRIKVKS